jgi:hypothetical protein
MVCINFTFQITNGLGQSQWRRVVEPVPEGVARRAKGGAKRRH